MFCLKMLMLVEVIESLQERIVQEVVDFCQKHAVLVIYLLHLRVLCES